jgi:hypothetical protein
MYRYKYAFLDVLLKKWYIINKNILKEKIHVFKDTNSLFFYNSYKNLLYIIIYIFKKHKIQNYFHFINIYRNVILQKTYLMHIINNNQNKRLIKKTNWTIFKNKLYLISLIQENKSQFFIFFDSKNNSYISLIKRIFIDKFYYYNIIILRKEFSIRKLCIINNFDNNGKMIEQYRCFIYFLRWMNFSLKNAEETLKFYLYKNKYFQCNNFIYVYKRKLRDIYNTFINNYNRYYSTKFNNNEKRIQKEIEISPIINPLKNIFVKRRINAFICFYSFYYSITKNIIFFYCLFNYI